MKQSFLLKKRYHLVREAMLALDRKNAADERSESPPEPEPKHLGLPSSNPQQIQHYLMMNRLSHETSCKTMEKTGRLE